MKWELIRQLTPEERAEAMEIIAWENVREAVAVTTLAEAEALVERELKALRFYGGLWDEMRREKWPQHYFETKTLNAAGPLGWLCWLDVE